MADYEYVVRVKSENAIRDASMREHITRILNQELKKCQADAEVRIGALDVILEQSESVGNPDQLQITVATLDPITLKAMSLVDDLVELAEDSRCGCRCC